MTRSTFFGTNRPTLLLIEHREDRQMPMEVYYQKVSQYLQENT